MKRSLFFAGVILLPLLSVLSAKSLHAQVGADRVAVTGLVTDPSGAAIPHATVTLINGETGIKTVVATDSAGNYSTPAMVLGTNYTLEVAESGFKTYVHPGLDLTIGGRTYTENVKLEVGKAIPPALGPGRASRSAEGSV
jgi:Carboxypeptidase regulatory-like domain